MKLNIKNKKGVSGVITVVILVAIVLSLLAIVWSVILPMVKDSLDKSEACSPDILNKIKLNRDNTCYDEKEDAASNPTDGIIKVSVEIKDLEYDEILVYVTQGGTTKSFPIEGQDKNSGKTYDKELVGVFGFTSDTMPDVIKLIPVIDGVQCQAVDSINDIKTCSD